MVKVKIGKKVYEGSLVPEAKRSLSEALEMLRELEERLEPHAPVILKGVPGGQVAPVKPTRREGVYLDKSYFNTYVDVDSETSELAVIATRAAEAYSGKPDLVYLGDGKWLYVADEWVWKGMRFVKGEEIPREKLAEKMTI